MPNPEPPSVRVRDLTRRYGEVHALRGISFDAAPGEVFGLLGPNGAGKTTALECLLGLRRPDSGTVEIAGVDAFRHPEITKPMTGALIQAATLQDAVTPRQALRLFASFYEKAGDPDDLMERFGLAAKADTSFGTLSGGQRQRLFLALAFVNNPTIVVLDEPTAGLDPSARRELHQLIAGARSEGRTVVLSTHDLGEAEELCDRVAIIDRGRVLAAGSPAELRARAGVASAIEFRTREPMPEATVQMMPGVTGCRASAGGWTVATSSVTDTLAGISSAVASGHHRIVELRVVQPTLEEVFLSLTATRGGGEGRDRP